MKSPGFAEVAVLWVAGLAVLFFSERLAAAGGWVAENAGALAAGYFLLVPVIFLRWRGLDPADFGIHTERVRGALRTAGVAALIVFPPYCIAYEVWSRAVDGEGFRWPAHPWTYYETAARGRPLALAQRDGIHVFVEAERLFVIGASDGRASVRVEGCGPAGTARMDADGVLRFSGPSPQATRHSQGAAFWTAPGRGAVCEVFESDRLIVQADPPVPWLLGAQAAVRDPGPLTLDRSALWLFELLLVNLVAVALPEEVFYRGYVQSRLAPWFRRRVRVLGTPIGAHVFVASALFAVSHLVSIPHPFRLAVFFPGLLFGHLRERTGGVLAPAVLHAASNVLLEILVRFHGPLG